MLKHTGKELTPWDRVTLLNRAIAGENRRVLEEEFGVHRATINRWVAKWAKKKDEPTVKHLPEVASA